MTYRLRATVVAVFALFLTTATARAADTFARGADVSWLPQMEAGGFQFRDSNGQPGDCLKILQDHGINAIRLRVFVNPSDNPHSGHCSKAETLQLASRAAAMGFRILIDFHYSDTWADPQHQNKPAAWADHSIDQLVTDVHDHTADVLSALKQAGIMPEWVQVGNEIPGGMLWPEGRSKHMENLARLINAGSRAVKEIDPTTKVVIHLDTGGDANLYRWFFDSLTQHGGTFDVIGMSYYPPWLKDHYTPSLDALRANLADVSARYHKEVMVCEVGGPSTQPAATYDLLRGVLKAVHAVPDGKGLGVFYWEPEGAKIWSGYSLSCWANDGRPTHALDAFLDDQGKD